MVPVSSPYMGPLPAAPGCDCRVCRPDEQYDKPERNCIDTVLESGWQVLLVGAGDEADEPAFAYTVGLPHRAGHPELVMSGLPSDVMHSALNDVARRVLDGARLTAGAGLEGVLAGVPLVVDELADAALERTVTWSRWFHRTSVGALQLVWPDTIGRFAWQPGSSAALDTLQPPDWRRLHPREGGFAADPPWPLPVPPDTLAFVCTHVEGDGDVIRFVAREPDPDRGEDWTFHCGQDHGDGIDQITLLHIAHVLRSAPSVREVADLRLGESASRAGDGDAWRRDQDR
jgi:Domain of unknown function (DUF4262)